MKDFGEINSLNSKYLSNTMTPSCVNVLWQASRVPTRSIERMPRERSLLLRQLKNGWHAFTSLDHTLMSGDGEQRWQAGRRARDSVVSKVSLES